MAHKRKLVYPGQILLNQFLTPLGITQSKIARDIDVPRTRISEIIKGKRSITVDTALRLGKYFNSSAQFWLNMQMLYDLRVVENETWCDIEPRIRPINIAADVNHDHP